MVSDAVKHFAVRNISSLCFFVRRMHLFIKLLSLDCDYYLLLLFFYLKSISILIFFQYAGRMFIWQLPFRRLICIFPERNLLLLFFKIPWPIYLVSFYIAHWKLFLNGIYIFQLGWNKKQKTDRQIFLYLRCVNAWRNCVQQNYHTKCCWLTSAFTLSLPLAPLYQSTSVAICLLVRCVFAYSPVHQNTHMHVSSEFFYIGCF